jgi:capsular exopolysaccharide synthesis family protein
MSRIEEALRRVERGDRSHDLEPPLERAQPQVGDQTLAHFPLESGNAALAEHFVKPSLDHPTAALLAVTPRPAPQTAAAIQSRRVLDGMTPLALEQYRRLAATLHDLQTVHGTKTVMVSSALPREGKTLTITNLALTLSESYGRRVLLIDADLRRPSVHEMFGLPNGAGLSEGLRLAGELAPVAVSPRLSVLLAGRPTANPLAGLTSDRMRLLLKEAASRFDWVLLDAPPIGIMPDASVLARLTQGVIFVVAAGSTPFALVERAVTEFGREHIIGTVLNRMADENIPATTYYGGYYDSTEPA